MNADEEGEEVGPVLELTFENGIKSDITCSMHAHKHKLSKMKFFRAKIMTIT